MRTVNDRKPSARGQTNAPDYPAPSGSALLRAPAAWRQPVTEGAGIKPDIDRTSPLLRRWKDVHDCASLGNG